jgi:hypothetical protein
VQGRYVYLAAPPAAFQVKRRKEKLIGEIEKENPYTLQIIILPV